MENIRYGRRKYSTGYGVYIDDPVVADSESKGGEDEEQSNASFFYKELLFDCYARLLPVT